MFNYKSKIRKRAACRAEAARSVSVLESVDVDIEFVGQVREVCVKSISVIFKFDSRVVRIIYRQVVFVVEFFKVSVGRDVESHVIVVAGRDCVYEFNVREVGRQMFRDISK